MFKELVFYILSYDLWFYLSHRLLHTPFGYKHVHRYHHAVDYKTIRYKDTYVGHLVESPFQGLGILFPLLFLRFSLLQFSLAVILVNTRGMFRHDARFVWLIGNHHILHHQYPQTNYGEYWLDCIFRTKFTDLHQYRFGLFYI